MVRAFKNHEIRKTYELDGLWDACANDKKLKLPVPGSWEMHPELCNHRGKVVYTKEIETKEKCNLRFIFKGVSHTAAVSFDGELRARHYNAYTPFSVFIKDVSIGKHILVIEVDNSFSEASALHVPNDYFTYGGLIRPVVVEEIFGAYIDRVEFTPNIADNGMTSAKIKVFVTGDASAQGDISISGEINGCQLSFDSCIGESELVFEKDFLIPGVELWDIENPNLYLLKIFLKTDGAIIDDLVERVGFRTIKVIGKKIYLNGKELFLKGFNRHEDHPLFGVSLPFQAMATDIELIRGTGANTVRTSHYPNDELFLDLCDEYGILVWEENHARGLSEDQMRNPNFDRQCEDCINEMITNHFNHPSIVIWGLLNECASHTEYGRQCYEKQITQIRSLDSSRPVTYASCQNKNDICLGLADIISYNLYSGWYVTRDTKEFLDDLYAWVQENGGCDKPMILSEFGAGAIYGYRDIRKVKWSEERQADILRDNLSVYSNYDGVVGTLIWQFCDCLVSDEDFYGRPRTKNNKGIFDEYRRPKLAYGVVKEFFNK